jgi:hypothetical protein
MKSKFFGGDDATTLTNPTAKRKNQRGYEHKTPTQKTQTPQHAKETGRGDLGDGDRVIGSNKSKYLKKTLSQHMPILYILEY